MTPTRALYSTDASIYRIDPWGCPRHRRPGRDCGLAPERVLLPAAPVPASLASVGRALVLDCSRHMDQILEINPRAGCVQPVWSSTGWCRPAPAASCLADVAQQPGLPWRHGGQ